MQIARALIDGAAKLVVFDEPTAPLEAQEASLVSSAILRLREQGIAILLFPTISTKSPPFAIAVRCCVTARSSAIPTGSSRRIPTRWIKMMVGRDREQLYTLARAALIGSMPPRRCCRFAISATVSNCTILALIFSRRDRRHRRAAGAPGATCWSICFTSCAAPQRHD